MTQADVRVRNENEVGRVASELAGRFHEVSADTIRDAVRSEFDRRSTAKVQDFVPIFVERELRQVLREVR